MEARRRNSGPLKKVMVIGVGETAHQVLRHMEHDLDGTMKPVCMVDFREFSFGAMMEGIPVVGGVDAIVGATKAYEVESVILADTTMPGAVRKRVREICDELNLEVQDYVGYFQESWGAMTLSTMVAYATSEVELVINGVHRKCANGKQAAQHITEHHAVKAIYAKNNRLVIELQTPLALMYITNDPTVAQIAEKNGVQRVWIDLETLGKEERQKNLNTVKSHHCIHDIEVISNVLTTSEVLVRVNPINPGSEEEINQVIAAGADMIKPLVEMLHAHGCEVHVAAKDNLAEKNGLKLDFVEKVYNVPFARSPKSTDNIKAYKQLKRIIDEGNYDVVHCNTPMGGIVTRLAAREARKQGTKVFYMAHGFHFYKGAPKKNWIVFYPIEKFFANHYTDKLITITAEDYKLAREKFRCEVVRIHGVGVDEKRYYPVDKEEQLRLREELGFTPDQKILLCVGELLPNKNQKMAIHAMREVVKTYPDAQLLLAGNGPEKENLEAEINACGLERNVKLLGYCTYLEKYQRITDVLLACSHREGLPLNLVEAMLTGNPVVASVNRGHRELIRDGENGYLVQDAQTMAERLIALCADPVKRNAVGQSARDYAIDYGAANVKKSWRGFMENTNPRDTVPNYSTDNATQGHIFVKLQKSPPSRSSSATWQALCLRCPLIRQFLHLLKGKARVFSNLFQSQLPSGYHF